MNTNMQVIVLTPAEAQDMIARAVRDEVAQILRGLRRDTNSDLTEAEAAQYLKRSPNTLRTWRTQGIGPAYSKAGHGVRYKLEDLEAFNRKDRRITADDPLSARRG